MSTSQQFILPIWFIQLIAISSAAYGQPTARPEHGSVKYSRQIQFKLTFANQDLIWLGDPASPTALMYLKRSVVPIATDVFVATHCEDHESLGRRYFREARIVEDAERRTVYAFTEKREKAIGSIDDKNRFLPNDFYAKNRELLPTWPADASALTYDSQQNALYAEVALPGPIMSESLDFLPLNVRDAEGNPLSGSFSIEYEPSGNSEITPENTVVLLKLKRANETLVLAKAIVPNVFRRADVTIGSFDKGTQAYLPEAAYRASAVNNKDTEPSVTVAIAGGFMSSVRANGANLIVASTPQTESQRDKPGLNIVIDGNFDDWRNVPGVDDGRGDVVPYLEYVSDVDLLEFKVSHDDEHIYLYARVAGQVGRSHPDGGRSYFYAYMDVDQNPGTGFLPTRDDDCYFGVDIGDDCEVQFEFVNNAFRKSFYGFCGIGGNVNVLKQQVTLGKSQYGRFDANGAERANYKAEYIYRNGITEITEDLKLGTSDTIQVAVSPDGSEVEVMSSLKGFLKDRNGRPTLALGQTIDLAVGMECDSKAYPGKIRWAADSTSAIRGYQLTPAKEESTRSETPSRLLRTVR